MTKEALIIVDMSNDFVADNGTLTAGKPAQEIVPYISELAKKFIKEDNFVIVAMDAHLKNDAHFDLWPEHNVIGTKGQELYGELYDLCKKLETNTNYLYIQKQNYNAFFETSLAKDLRLLNVDKVHIVGVCTDICIFLTASGADAEGFKTVVHKRGAATFTDQGEIFINHMKTCFHTEIIE